MSSIVRTLALTGYGLVGTDWTRLTAVVLETGAVVVGRITGRTAAEGFVVSDTLPSAWRTSGDITSAASKLDHKVSMSAVPSVGLMNHEWKGTFTLDEIASKFGISTAHLAALKAAYVEEAEAAA